jgi:putative oxidoreductase
MSVMKNLSRLTHLTPRICSAVETSMSSSLNIARRWDAARWAPIPLRLIVGYGFMAHGYAKLMKDPDVFVGILHAIGVPAPHVMAWLTILVELLGGLAILLGAFVPLVSLPMAAVLLMAIFTVHLPYGFTSIKLMAVTAAGPPFGPPRYETDLLYLACLAALVAGGSGPFSVDRFIANRLSRNGNVAMLPAGDCFNSGLISQYTPLASPTAEGPVPKKNAKAQFSPRGAIAPRASGTIWEKPVE